MFACVAHVKKVSLDVMKLSDKSMQMVFLGYEEGSKAYRVYNPGAKKLHVTRDVVFQEKKWDWASTLTKSIDCGDNYFTVGYTAYHVIGSPINVMNMTLTIDERSLG